ncbi:hypothetical protein D3C81_2220090 [compost metagenome]
MERKQRLLKLDVDFMKSLCEIFLQEEISYEDANCLIRLCEAQLDVLLQTDAGNQLYS